MVGTRNTDPIVEPAATPSASDVAAWCGRREACRILGVSWGVPDQLVEKGLISAKAIPGQPTRYLRSDVERVARESVRAATATVAGITREES